LPPSSSSNRKLALITGASSGIGAAFARAYAAKGYDVALTARRADRLAALGAELIAAHGIEVIVVPADLSLFEGHAPILAELAARARAVDVLVNCAGFSIAHSFAATAWAQQRDFLMTLIVSACGLTHGVIGAMAKNGRGAIINVASLAGFAPGVAGHTLYPGAKSLAIKFSQSLDDEVRAKGIRVTAVCPGFTLTEFAAANGTQEIIDKANRRLFQTADEVARIAIAANERGQVVVVPGLHNKIAAALMRYLPEPLVRAVLRVGAAKYHLQD
jgi:short-subunit dehydrogenase